jgi:hypothetical protein
MFNLTRQQLLGLGLSALIVVGAVTAWRPTTDVGYIEIKTVPVAPVTPTALYIDSRKLAPIKKGNAILRQPIGTLKLQTDGVAAGSLAPLCEIVVRRNRITTVTVSLLDRPPRCQCRNGGTDAAHACVS